VTEESSCGWEALSGDPLPWPLDEHRPNLLWRVLVELLWAAARAGVPFERRLAAQVVRLQRLQGLGGRWPRRALRPSSLPIPSRSRAPVCGPRQWVTLRAVVAINAYAVDARMPRRLPQPPAR